MVATQRRFALLHELREAPEPSLPDLVARLAPCELVLVEGFKRAPIAKLEVHRTANASPPLYPDDPNVIALCTDARLGSGLPEFWLDDYAGVAAFIMGTLKLRDANGDG
jgi:molybdopterin-guanine dinucleotide biosynthesis protein B